jgi:hypothetical protein
MKKVNNKSLKPVQEFVKEIEAYVKESKLDYLDAVLHYCELNSLEIETVAAMIRSSSRIKAKIQQEAEDANYLPKTGKLPV